MFGTIYIPEKHEKLKLGTSLVRPTVCGPPHVAVAAVRRRPRELEITERQVGLERGPVPAPSLLVRLEVRRLPVLPISEPTASAPRVA